MKISVITLFPEMFKGPFDISIVKRAIDKKILDINLINLRDFGEGKHKLVDDRPYGGGFGMILRVDILGKAIESVKDKSLSHKEQRIILLAAAGKTFTQKKAQTLSKLKHLIIICGHYEGVDARVNNLVDEVISIGDYITTGGEIPAMLIIDSVSRLITGTLKKGVTKSESFSSGTLEYPQYTKPRIYKQSFQGSSYKKSYVPKILLSGNHKKIEEWRKNESLRTTSRLRPDLLKK